MREHERIATYFAPLAQSESGSFGLTDDAAVLAVPPGKSLVVTTDSVIESIHVFAGATPAQFAQKLMRRNLSDLAAMGAMPWRYTLNLHTPQGLAEEWFAEFSTTLAAEQTQFSLTLAGGDSTFGKAGAAIHTMMTCFGLLEGSALRRNGARIGDDIYISGTIGDAALGLILLQQNPQQNDPASQHLIDRYHLPQPRLVVGSALRGIATAAMDISDGLIADLTHLCTASNVGATVEGTAIPLSPAAQHYLATDPTAWHQILHGGDDYELCFTAPQHQRATVMDIGKKTGIPLTRIGSMSEGKIVTVIGGRA